MSIFRKKRKNVLRKNRSMNPKIEAAAIKVHVQIEGPEDEREEISLKLKTVLLRMKHRDVGYVIDEVQKINY